MYNSGNAKRLRSESQANGAAAQDPGDGPSRTKKPQSRLSSQKAKPNQPIKQCLRGKCVSGFLNVQACSKTKEVNNKTVVRGKGV